MQPDAPHYKKFDVIFSFARMNQKRRTFGATS